MTRDELGRTAYANATSGYIVECGKKHTVQSAKSHEKTVVIVATVRQMVYLAPPFRRACVRRIFARVHCGATNVLLHMARCTRIQLALGCNVPLLPRSKFIRFRIIENDGNLLLLKANIYQIYEANFSEGTRRIIEPRMERCS